MVVCFAFVFVLFGLSVWLVFGLRVVIWFCWLLCFVCELVECVATFYFVCLCCFWICNGGLFVWLIVCLGFSCCKLVGWVISDLLSYFVGLRVVLLLILNWIWCIDLICCFVLCDCGWLLGLIVFDFAWLVVLL